MVATVSADNGSVSGSAGIKLSSDSSGVLALQSGANTTAITIDASQNVGIGTASPTALTSNKALTINSPTGFGSLLDLKTNETLNLRVFSNASNSGLSVKTATPLLFDTNDTERMRIDSSGNVMVATTSSAGKLNVAGQVTATGGIFKANGAPSLSAATAGEAMLAPDGGSGALLYGQGTNYDVAICQRSTAVALGVLANSTNVYAAGNFFVNQTSQTGAEKVGISFSRAGNWGLAIKNTSATSPSGATYVSFYYTSTNTGSINSTGTTTTYDSASDYRLKENIAPMTGALAKVTQLKPCTYTWKINGSVGQGFLAHELQEIVSDCVRGNKDDVNEDGSIKPQMIDTSFLVATLTAAIQELKAINDTQAETINALTARIVALESK